MQLLSYQAPLSALILVGFVPIFDNYKEILAYKMTAMAALAISTSAILAFIVNMSTFMIIGKMSAITYNVAGHAKLCFVLASGYLIFDSKFSWLNMGGVGLAISGVVAYSVIKMMPAKTSEITAAQSVTKPSEEQASVPFIQISVNESDAELTEPRRSLLIMNNEPILTSSKVAPLLVGKLEEVNDAFGTEAKETQILIK